MLCAHGHGVLRLCGCVDVGLCVGCGDVGMWGCGDVGMWGCGVVWPCGCVVVRLCGSTLVTEAALKYPEDPASEDPEEWSRSHYGRAATHMPHQAHGMGWWSLLMLHNALCIAALKAWASQAP